MMQGSETTDGVAMAVAVDTVAVDTVVMEAMTDTTVVMVVMGMAGMASMASMGTTNTTIVTMIMGESSYMQLSLRYLISVSNAPSHVFFIFLYVILQDTSSCGFSTYGFYDP